MVQRHYTFSMTGTSSLLDKAYRSPQFLTNQLLVTRFVAATDWATMYSVGGTCLFLRCDRCLVPLPQPFQAPFYLLLSLQYQYMNVINGCIIRCLKNQIRGTCKSSSCRNAKARIVRKSTKTRPQRSHASIHLVFISRCCGPQKTSRHRNSCKDVLPRT